MAHHTDRVGFPNILLKPGMKLVLEAIDPSLDATVSGLTSSRWAIYGDKNAGAGAGGGADLPDYVPPFTVIEEG